MLTRRSWGGWDPSLRYATFHYAVLFLATLLSGCTSATKLRWDAPAAPPFKDELDQGQSNLPKRRGRSKPETPPAGEPREGDAGVVQTASPAPSSVATSFTTPVVPPSRQEFPIDLTTALRLAEVENPLIALARQRIGEALAVQQGARALLFPTLNIGTSYSAHTGNLQRSSGTILNLDKQSLYFGGGAGAVTAGSIQVPAVSIFSPLTDAIFEPLAARQQVQGARLSASATANAVLLEVAELHFELLAAEADLRVRLESAAQEAEVARLTRAYADAQQGREADAQRAATELSLIVDQVRQAEEDAAVASARLARRLHLDQSVRVRPASPAIEMITIVDPAIPLPSLIETALRGRPEIGAQAASIAAAEVRHRQERYRPLLPTIWIGFSAGAFGGGSNLVGSQLANFAGRTDFDAQVFWTLQNFGLGNLARQKARYAELGQAVGAQSRTIAEVRTEVAAAYADVAAARHQIDVTARQLRSAEAGFREDLERIRNTVGRPLEVVNSLQLLNEARVARIRALTDYNKAEVRLFVALGSPPPLGESANAPLPPAPIATPPLPPLAAGSGPTVR
ncbi:MAG: TolC family protein [Isosphaeraceae bacterium]|nr:TolC family protein [Isosphaeraceae bacterium]